MLLVNAPTILKADTGRPWLTEEKPVAQLLLIGI